MNKYKHFDFLFIIFKHKIFIINWHYATKQNHKFEYYYCFQHNFLHNTKNSIKGTKMQQIFRWVIKGNNILWLHKKSKGSEHKKLAKKKNHTILLHLNEYLYKIWHFSNYMHHKMFCKMSNQMSYIFSVTTKQIK